MSIVTRANFLSGKVTCSNVLSHAKLNVKFKNSGQDNGTVNVVIFAGGKFRKNAGKTFHVGVIFTIFHLFP